MELYDRIVNPDLLVRRVNVTANHVIEEKQAQKKERYEQLNLFTDYGKKGTGRERGGRSEGT